MTVALDVGPLRPNPAGVGVYVRSLAQGLAALGRDDVVYIGRRPDAEGLPDGVPSIGRRPGSYAKWVQLDGHRSVQRSRADVVHFADGLVPLIRSRPTALTVLDLSLVRHWRSHRAIRYPRIPLVMAAPRLADTVIAISQATADEVVRLTRTPARKIVVVPLAPRQSARPADQASIDALLRWLGLSGRGFLLVPGTLEPRKNHIRVIEAFEELVRRSEVPLDLSLVFAGDRGWKAEETLAKVAESPVRDRIRLLGYVPEADLAALMSSAAAVVYASTYEGFGLPILEAMACGAVVVTSNVSSLPEVAGDAGVLVDPYDPSAIGRGILEALAVSGSELARRAAIAHAGRFTWRKTAAATAEVYDSLAR